jgi:hypothetical protein
MFFLPAVRQSRWRIVEILDSLFFSGSQLRARRRAGFLRDSIAQRNRDAW